MAFPELPDDRRARPRRHRGSDAPAAEQGERNRRSRAEDTGVEQEQDFLLGAALQRGVPARYGAAPPGPDGEPSPERTRAARSRRAAERDRGSGLPGPTGGGYPDAGGRAAYGDPGHGADAPGPDDRATNGRNGRGPEAYRSRGAGTNGHDGNGRASADGPSGRHPAERLRDSYAYDGTGPDTGPRRRPPREERPPARSRGPQSDDRAYGNAVDVPPAGTGSHRAPVRGPEGGGRPDGSRPDAEQDAGPRVGRRRAQEPGPPPFTGTGAPEMSGRNGAVSAPGHPAPDRNGRPVDGPAPGRHGPDPRQRHQPEVHGDRPNGDRPYGDRPYGDRPYGDRSNGYRAEGVEPRRRAPEAGPPRPFEGPPPRRRVAEPVVPPPFSDEPTGRRRAPDLPGGPRAYAGDEPALRPAPGRPAPPTPPGDGPAGSRARHGGGDRGVAAAGVESGGPSRGQDRIEPGTPGDRPARPRTEAGPGRRASARHGSSPTEAIAAGAAGLGAAADSGLSEAGPRNGVAAQDTTALPGRRRRGAEPPGRARPGAGPADVDGAARARDPARGDPGAVDRPGAAALADAPGDDDPDATTVTGDTDGPREGKRSGPSGIAGKLAALTSRGGRSGGDDGEKKPMSFWKELPLLVGVALVLTFLISTFVAKVFVIPSGSMETTLHGCTGCTNDRVLVDKVTYNFTDISPGDVVVFRGPDSWSSSEYEGEPPSSGLMRGLQMAGSLIGLSPPDEKDFVKRVIAVGGQTVACCDALNQVMVDGQPLDEPYTYYLPEAGPARQIPFGPITVPQGEMWMMGDSRNNSADSRASGHGPVPEENVIGKVRLIVLPFDRFGWVDAVDPQTSQTAMGAGTGGLPAGAPLALGMMGTFPFALSRRRSLRRRAEDERFLPQARRRNRWRARI